MSLGGGCMDMGTGCASVEVRARKKLCLSVDKSSCMQCYVRLRGVHHAAELESNLTWG